MKIRRDSGNIYIAHDVDDGRYYDWFDDFNISCVSCQADMFIDNRGLQSFYVIF